MSWSQNISIHFEATDEASRVVEAVGETTKQTLNEVSQAAEETSRNWSQVWRTTKNVTKSFSGLTTAAWGLYQSIDRVQDMQLTLDRANLKVKATLNALEDAQRRYNEAVAKYGADSPQAKAAADDLALAEERHRIATEAAKEAQERYNETIMQTAWMVVPQAVTALSSLWDMLKNIPPIHALITTISARITALGISASTAAMGVGALVGGFTLGYTAIQMFGEALGPVGRALMAIIPIIIAAAAAIWTLQSGWTLGAALVILAATMTAVGAMVANLQSYGNVLGLAEGGIVTKPTLALIGEIGPEAVIPLRRGLPPTKQYITVNSRVEIYGGVSSEIDLERIEEHVNRGIADALRRRLP